MNNGMLVNEKVFVNSSSDNLAPLMKGIDNLTKVMKNKREMSIHPHVLGGMAKGIVVDEKKGLTRERTIYKS
jgi:hypothetical protein